jgi:hypothetical protein
MNAYKPSTSRVASGLIAVAMAAITIGAMVVLPAKLDSGSADPYALAAAEAATTAPVEVAVDPARGDPSAVGDRAEHVHADRTNLAAREFRAKRHKLSLRSRTAI